MTNEELAAVIRAGDPERLMELWTQVAPFARVQARRRPISPAADYEDMHQAAFLALIEAVSGYDPAAGMSFLGWYVFHLKSAFAEANGQRSEKQQHDPIHTADSLERPLYNGADDISLGDTVADSTDDMGNVEKSIWLEELHAALEMLLASLPPEQRTVLRLNFYEDMPLSQIAAELETPLPQIQQRHRRALTNLRRSKNLLSILQPFLQTANGF